MRGTIRLLTFALTAGLSVPALAAPAAPAEDDADAQARQGTTQKYIFDGDTLEGENISPTGVQLNGRATRRHESMIRLRAHWIDHMTRLSNDMG